MAFLFGKRRSAPPPRETTRIYFATDLHGSGVVFRKLLNGALIYGCQHVVLGGDITGKMLIPVIKNPDGTKRATIHGEKRILKNKADEKQFQEILDMLGFYHVCLSEDEFKEMEQDQKRVERVFNSKAYSRLIEWINLAAEKFSGHNLTLYISGGNDDTPESLKALSDNKTSQVVGCEGRQIKLNDIYTMVSLGISNPTPWHTPREYPEETIAKKIEEALTGLVDFHNVIFNFHVPPYNCTLDMCPELDATKDPPAPVMSGGQQVFKPVGSTAVREAIEKYQPLLVLCGHIHESRGVVKIGRTTIVNPGSEYGEGVLRGVIINLRGSEVLSYQMTSG